MKDADKDMINRRECFASADLSKPDGSKHPNGISDWAAPCVWTDRMLTALEEGVKGGKWHSLMDKVYRLDNLYMAFMKVKDNRGGPGIDNQTIDAFENRLSDNLNRLHEELKSGGYKSNTIKRVWIPKPGGKEKRPLGIPTVRDRVVQAALRNVIEPIFEIDFSERSYGFRPGRGCKDALRRVDTLLKSGYRHVVDADLKSYFDTIPHDKLMKQVERKVSDGRVLGLVEHYLKQGVMSSHEGWDAEEGTPQGAVISPLLSNIYLDPLDKLMSGSGYEMVRYADDFVILCRNEAEAQAALKLVSVWTESNGLKLHPVKTRIVSVDDEDGFVFLGYHFKKTYKLPSDKSLRKFRDNIRKHTRRANGHSLEEIIKRINRTLIGWYNYFKHCNKSVFPGIDGWVRMRLRSILRKRHGGKGRGRGADNQRWPNAYFADLGLFSTTAAHKSALSTPYGANH